MTVSSEQPAPAAGEPATPPAGEVPLLVAEGVSLSFGGVHALVDVDLTVRDGEIVGLVGPNGAGKTSLFNCVCGYYRPSSGSIKVRGTEVTHRASHELMGLGVARTFQHPVLQQHKSVLENVLVGGHTALHRGPLAYTLRLPGVRRSERELTERAMGVLDSLGIARLAALPAGELSYGGMKRVELARALLSGPSLLLLDELASGLTQSEVMALGEQIRGLRDSLGVGIALVEHHMGVVSAICDRVVVLVQGRKVVEGTAAEVQQHPTVIEAYLGTAAA